MTGGVIPAEETGGEFVGTELPVSCINLSYHLRQQGRTLSRTSRLGYDRQCSGIMRVGRDGFHPIDRSRRGPEVRSGGYCMTNGGAVRIYVSDLQRAVK